MIDSSITHTILAPDKSQTTLRDTIEEHTHKLRDGYSNSLLSIGNDNKSDKYTQYTFDNDTLNYWLWTTLYNDSWVFKRAIDKPAQDEIRCGITLHGKSDFSKVYKQLKRLRSDFISLLQWGALYGGSIACIMFDNALDEDYSKPINYQLLKNSKSIKFYVVDRWYGITASNETVDDMTSFDFGKPKYYKVTFPDGNSLTFHHSYVLRYEHRNAPKLVKNGMLQGWGYAEGAHILQQLMRDDKLEASIQSLVDKSLIEVIKMSGMRGVFMGGDTQSNEQLQKRLEMVNWARNFNSLTFLDKDDEYQEHSFSGLSGLSNLLEINMWRISSALEMQGVLFGDLKQGFSNDADALERYDETINNRCEAYLRPIYEKFIHILFKIYDIDEDVDFDFNSLLMKKHDLDDITTIQTYAQLLSQMLNDGVINTQQYAKSINTFIETQKPNFYLDEDAINKLAESQIEESEMFGETLV